MNDQFGGVPGVFDYRTQPLGSLPGEGHLQVPYNLSTDRVLVRVRNISAIQRRRTVKEAVSIRRGGNQQLKDKERMAHFGSQVSPVELQFRVANGDDMNWYGEDVVPTDFIIRFDGRRYKIPFEDEKTKEPAPWCPVPPGAYDLFCGNWDAMHSRDARDRTDELARLMLRGLHKWVVGDDHPDGLLEFEREIIQVAEVSVDEKMIAAGRLIEV